ncbi:MAG: NAD-dependent epimerase/dehydratase [Vicinamibacterales bacterium]
MRVLVTGADGYIGSLLAPYLADRGHDVTGLDTGFYREGWLPSVETPASSTPRVSRKDLRRIEASDLQQIDAIVHLAELSNDPLGELAPSVTYAINHRGSVHLAHLAKAEGISRFVYASSCAVYGASDADVVNEESTPDPQTAYAKCKLLVERDVSALADDTFTPVFLRNATAFGASPRMRFDIVLNNLAGLARTRHEIVLTSDGTPWRPLVHVRDICKAMACALEAPADTVRGQVFNVGDNAQNYRVRDIASIVADTFPGCDVRLGSNGGDRRSYRVSFDRIHQRLPGFSCEWDAARGATQLRTLFERIDLTAERFQFRAFTRLDALKYLLRTEQIDAELFWRA